MSHIDISGSAAAGHIEGKLTADAKDTEGISYISSTPGDPYKHSFKYKLPLLKFVGDISVGGKKLVSCSKNKPCVGLMDNARGYYPYAEMWWWGTTCFESGGHQVAFNFEHSTDNPHSSFDAVFVDGKLFKLDPLVMQRVSDSHWKWKSHPDVNQHSKNIVELEFHKDDTHTLHFNYLLYEIKLKSNFGKFSGKIKTEKGHTITFKDKFGFIEDFRARW